MKQHTNIIDISWPITSDMTTYKNNKIVSLSYEKSFEEHQVRDSNIAFNSHTGTHIDAPSHFLKNGKSIETISLQTLVGTCRVIDLSNVEGNIAADDLKPYNIQPQEIILLQTKNSSLAPTASFDFSFVYLDNTGAQFLADIGVTTVGVDYLGIKREQPNHETHCILLEKNITIIEGLRLAGVAGNREYFLSCLPLAINGLEAAPARAILIE